MPYLKSNWESLPPLDEFGRFSFGEIFTIPDLTLTQAPGTKGCYLHVAMEHLSRLQELELVCSATTMIVNIMRGKSTTTMSYTYLTTIKGTPLEAQPGLFSYRIDDSLLSDVEIWQLQMKFLFPKMGETALQVKKVSLIVEDHAKKREFSMKTEAVGSKRSVLNRSNSTQVQSYVPPPPQAHPRGQPFSLENAVVVGLLVVDQVLGVMTKEIQENLEASCRGVEDKLLQDIAMLEDKMRRVEDAYEDINVDIRLRALESAIAQARGGSARASEPVEMMYDGDQPTVSVDAAEADPGFPPRTTASAAVVGM